MRYFAHALPGLGPLLAEEVAEHVEPLGRAFDGRNDVVSFEVRGRRPELRCAEDVFAEIGSVPSGPPAGGRAAGVAERLLDAPSLERALSVYAAAVGPLRRKMTFRVVARLRSERDFPRRDLREACSRRVGDLRPQWVVADPAAVELWVAEVDGSWLAGIRLTTGPRSSRHAERPGALRPSVAAAMVRQAGSVHGRLLDPFCGSGTIVLEAAAAGWPAVGADLDPAAVRTAAANGVRSLVSADASALPFAAATFAASVSNLPFGGRFPLPADPGGILTELARVTAPQGRLVLLAPPDLERAIDRSVSLETVEVTMFRLLGRRTTLWTLLRR